MTLSPPIARRLSENLAHVCERIDLAAKRSGRDAKSITLVAITKYVDAEIAAWLVEAGCHDLGESRPQELWHKAEQLQSLPVRWHLVGHLQRNKAKRTLPLVHLLHSGDSERLLESLNELAGQANRKLPALLEVNVSGDVDKHGFQPEELRRAWPKLAALSHLDFRGLMTMASVDRPGDASRVDFAALRKLRDDLQADSPPPLPLSELSMGMSGDFEQAIEEGATIVRIGSSLFEGVIADA